MAGTCSFLASVVLCLSVLAANSACASSNTGHYHVVDHETNKTCLIFNAIVSFSKVNVTNTMVSGNITPPSGEVDGSCNQTIADGKKQVDVVLFINTTSSKKVDNSTVSFVFTLNVSTNVWEVSSISLELETVAVDLADGVIHLEADLAGTTDKYSAGVNNSYQCNSGSSWNLKNSAGHGDGTLRVLNFTAQPFNVNGDTPSKDVSMCSGDSTPSTSNVVPIAVGAALCGLVLIVLVAYIIGRSRHQRAHKGYQSV